MTRTGAGFAAGLAVLVVLALASLAIGSSPTPVGDVLRAFLAYDPTDNVHLIVRELRVPRSLLAITAGAGLGLAGAVMSDDLDRCERVAGKLRAGIIWINCSQPTFTQVPGGGYKSSGIGRELGKSGFMGFREIKQITRYDHTRDWGWYLSK